MPRIALKITDNIVDMVRELTGVEQSPLYEDTYLLFDVISETEFHIQIVPEDTVFEEFKKDETLHIMGL